MTIEAFYQNTKNLLQMELVAGEKGLSRCIKVAEINRPGLALSGYFDYFASERVQVLGKVEVVYLKNMSAKLRRKRIKNLLDQNVPCVIIGRRYIPPRELLEEADKMNIPVFRSKLVTMVIMNKATLYLEDIFAAVVSVNADLVEVFGVGVLIRGSSGVGKSECALGLVERGHRLVSDDVVWVRYTAGGRLVGKGDRLMRHHLEARGLGIVNIQTIFGAASVLEEKEIELVISLEDWDSAKEYDRIGLDDQYYKLFDVDLPHITVPVRPGRDLVLLIEVAALNHRLKKMGHHASWELNEELIAHMKVNTNQFDMNSKGKKNGQSPPRSSVRITTSLG